MGETAVREKARQRVPMTKPELRRALKGCEAETVHLSGLLEQAEEDGKRLEFLEMVADQVDVRFNGMPWREAYKRLREIVALGASRG